MSETVLRTEIDPRYPIGRPNLAGEVTPESLQAAIADLAALPTLLTEALQGLDDAQLNTPYRDGGWTVRQLVHHIGDSHINAYVRVLLAITEDNPTVSDYNENSWALLPNSLSGPIEPSLAILTGLHSRWVASLQALKEGDWARTFVHPKSGQRNLAKTTIIYGWHSRHHVAHITRLRDVKGW